MFFLLLFPEIQSLSRARKTIGRVIETQVQLLPNSCKEALCYEAEVKVCHIFNLKINFYFLFFIFLFFYFFFNFVIGALHS
jgi:hypothetical protein